RLSKNCSGSCISCCHSKVSRSHASLSSVTITFFFPLPKKLASLFVEQRQGIKISAPEEIAYKYGWITKEKLLESAARYGKSPYGQHLKNVADDKLQY
ncbi:MAG: hypothetical protein PUJ48_10810, partial [Subdoligranulum variabile]|nr:hypothetical protein [Subdoligranulum variabile]